MAAKGWVYEDGPLEDSAEKEMSSNISAGNIIDDSARRRKPPGGASTAELVQKSGPKRPRRGQRLNEQALKGKNDPQTSIESTTAEPSRDTRSMGKKSSNFHSDMPMIGEVANSEKPAVSDELESVIVVDRTPKRAKTKSRSSPAASTAKELVFHASEVDELERPEGPVIMGEAPVDDGNSAGTSSLGIIQANVRPSQSSTLQPSKASFCQSSTGNITGGLKNASGTVEGQPQDGYTCVAVANGASSTSTVDFGISTGLATESFNEERSRNNSATSISQRSGQTSPSTGFYGQSSLDDLQYTSPLLDQTPQRKLRSSFDQTNSLQDKSSILQTHESSTVLPPAPALSSSLLDPSNSTSHFSDSKSIASFQVNTSRACQQDRQDQQAHNQSITNVEDMADASTRQSSAIELDGESSSDLSDLDSSQEDFTDIEAGPNLNSPQPELADAQEPSASPLKSRPARQKKPTLKALQKQKQQALKKSRAQAPKEKNVLQKAAARAKAVTKKPPAKPKLPKAATRASGRKQKVEEEDEKDDFQPEKDSRCAISGPGVELRDRSTLKAPVSYLDRVVATADLMQKPGAKTGLKMVVSMKKTGKTSATKASAAPSNVRTPPRKATPSAPCTPRQSKKPPPKSTEPKLSPHDSGFSEVASTDNEQASSDFSPPSNSSSDSSQESSIISPSSPEEDAEEDIIEPSSPEVAPQRVRKKNSHFDVDVTVKDADARTYPPPGPELLELAQKAKAKGQIAKRWNPEVARRVDKIWMAPDKCDNCRADRYVDCDRAFPCSSCVKKGKICNLRTMMKKTACNNNPQYDEAITPLHLNAPIVSQNGDGTWNATKQTPPTTRPKKRKRGDTSKIIANKSIAKSQGRRAVSTTRDKRLNNGPRRSGEVLQHLKAPHTFQNGDATWNVTEQALPASSVDKRKRKYDGPSKATGNSSAKRQHRLPASGYSSSEETDLEDPANLGQALVRSKKVPRANRTYAPYHRSEQENLPAPYGEPPVWASKRQQLCEALPYYRAYMSGGYLHDGLICGLLIDKEIRERDVFGEEVVITRCGGGRKLDEATNKMIQTTHQERSAYGLGFERARDMRSPVAIIAGQGNSLSPSKLPHYYNVLDWFHVTDVWVENVEGFKTWCVRMEKIRLDEKSWWASAGSTLPNPDRDLNAIKAASQECLHCKNTSKVVFEQGWACLKASCDKFFVFGSPVDDRKLFYTEEFLKERTAYSGNAPGPLAPPLMTEADMIIAGSHGTEAAFKQGIVCPLCKGCSRRTQWSKWSCETAGCGFTHSLPFRMTSVKDTMKDVGRNPPQQNYALDFGIKYEAKRVGAYNVFEYGMPGPDGNVVGVLKLFKSTDVINHQPEGPNDLFRLMQESDFDLRRRPVRQPNSSGEILTNHFATNWGAPYKFVVTQSSRGFSEAPTVIVKALKRLTWAGEQALTDIGESFHPFNELLSIGYFEDCSIGFHDDGESTLGPTVATLSLGGSATMALRPKAKATMGNISRNAKGTKTPVLRVTLDHGDMVIMHGSGVQQYYEHEVIPSGTLRFALTCRYVRPDTLENDAEREDARIKGALPEGHEQYKYSGDENDIFTPEEMEKAKKTERLNALMRSLSDAAAIFRAGASQGDDDERCQMRDLMGQFENEALAPGVVGKPICRKDCGDEVDVTMPNAP